MFVFADEATTGQTESFVTGVVAKFVDVIVNPLIYVGFTIAFILFFIGILEFIASGQNPEKRDVGKRHMLWGIIGLFIFVASIWIVGTISGLVEGPTVS